MKNCVRAKWLSRIGTSLLVMFLANSFPAGSQSIDEGKARLSAAARERNSRMTEGTQVRQRSIRLARPVAGAEKSHSLTSPGDCEPQWRVQQLEMEQATSTTQSLTDASISATSINAADTKIFPPVVEENLAVAFLFNNHPQANQLAFLHPAARAGEVKITTTVIHNNSPRSVFVPGRQLIRGGRQDRVIRRSLIVPAGASATLPTMCVEKDRSIEGPDIITELAGLLPGAKLQEAVMEDNQHALWSAISDFQSSLTSHYLSFVNNNSPSSLPLTLADPSLLEKLGPFVERLQPRRDPSATGCAVFVNGKLSCIYEYHSTELFESMWPLIVQCHAAEAIAEKKLLQESSNSKNNYRLVAKLLATPKSCSLSSSHSNEGSCTTTANTGDYWYSETTELTGNWIERVYVIRGS